MAWNGLGTYVLNPSYSPEVNGTTIDAVRYNGLLTDVATGITQALNKNGENSPTANVNWGGFKITNLATPSTSGDALSWGKAANLAGVVGSANYLMSQSLNTTAGFDTTNTSAGTAAAGGFRAFNNSGQLAEMVSLGSGYTTLGILLAGSGGFYVDNTPGMFLCAAAGSIYFSAGGVNETFRMTTAGILQDANAKDVGGFKGAVAASVTTGAFVATDRGKCIYMTAGITVPNSTMAAEDIVYFQNTTSSALTITASIATLRLTGTTSTGNRTVAPYGRGAFIFGSSTLGYVSGDVS